MKPESKSSAVLGKQPPVAPEATGAFVSERTATRLNNAVTAWAGRASGGLPAPKIIQAYIDWLMNLGLSPGRQAQVLEKLVRSRFSLLTSLLRRAPEFSDRRFSAASWKRQPFAWLALAALHREELAKIATDPLPGMDRHNAKLVRFYTLQLVEVLSPQHFPLTNPEVLRVTREQKGKNLLRGARHAAGDIWGALRSKPPKPSAAFRVGENLAATPGKVIFRNALMELIQYSPTTRKVHPEPVLIVPAWIMKYYILDLSQQNSMVRWLVEQGHTVFMVSWKNPDAADRELSMDDYRRLGVLDALDVVSTVIPQSKIHAAGYCVGGTLLAISAAALARDGDERLASVTLFAAQTDFTDAGELKLFIDEMALHWLDGQMARRGYLESSKMGGAFGLLRSRDLIWQPLLRRYWMGENNDSFDIMAWNADGTRMPYRMHSDYLRQLYLENQLAEGKYEIGGSTVSVGDLKVPLFVVSTTSDHVAPWKSVYKIRNLKRLGETSFVLTNGGHNAGIVAEPGHPRRKFQFGNWDQDAAYQSADEWAAAAQLHEGSWWPTWQNWLIARSGESRTPPVMGGGKNKYPVLDDAPGTYVFQR